MVKQVRWADVDNEEMSPLLHRRYISGDRITLARIALKKGALVPMHSHENEQFAYVIEGALKFTLEDRQVIVRAGEVLCIPANAPHAAEALEDTIDLDVFSPAREDWAQKQDAYLRG